MQRIGYLSATMAIAAVLAASSSFATEMGDGAAGGPSPGMAADDPDAADAGGAQDLGTDDPSIGDAESADQPGALDDPGAVEDEGTGTPADAEAADGGAFDAGGAIQHQDELKADDDASIDADELDADELDTDGELTGDAGDATRPPGGFDGPGDIQEQDDLGTGAGTAGDELEASDDTAPTPGVLPEAMPEDGGQLGTPGAELDGSVEAPDAPKMGTGAEAGPGGYDAPGRIQEEYGSGSAAEALDDVEAAADPQLQRENLQQAIKPPAADAGAEEASADQ